MMQDTMMVEVTCFVRDKNKEPLLNFPIQGQYVGGVNVYEKKTDHTGHVRFKLQSGSQFKLYVYTKANTFELNATIPVNAASAARVVVLGVEHAASEFMGTLLVKIVDLDKKPVKKAKFIRHYMGKEDTKTCGIDGTKELKVLLTEPVVLTPLRATGDAFPRSNFTYQLRRIEKQVITITLPIHQIETETNTNEPTLPVSLTPSLNGANSSNNGVYYNIETGKYEGSIRYSNVGSVDDVYSCTGKTGTGNEVVFTNAIRVSMQARKFRISANIVIKEAGQSDEEELEIYCLAYTAKNHAAAVDSNMYSLLMTGYSSVTASEKTELRDSSNHPRSCYGRKAVLKALLGYEDPTQGAEFWDGTDFLAWGTGCLHHSNPQAKFTQYNHISIPKVVFTRYLARNLAWSHIPVTTGSAVYRATHKIYRYHGNDFIYPHPVFEDSSNFNSVGDFSYDTGAHRPNGIKGTINAGLTIFWKLI